MINCRFKIHNFPAASFWRSQNLGKWILFSAQQEGGKRFFKIDMIPLFVNTFKCLFNPLFNSFI